MRASRAVQEFQIAVDHLAVSRKPKRKLRIHRIEEQRLIAIESGRSKYGLTRQRRHEDLGFDSGHGHVGDYRFTQWKDSLLGQKHIAVESRAFVSRLQDVYDSVE